MVRAAHESLLSWDTAAEMLEVDGEEEVKAAMPALMELFPSVFSGGSISP